MPTIKNSSIEIDCITTQVLSSKNYQSLDPDMVRLTVASLVDKYSSKTIVKEVKNKLHQVWGAFYDNHPNFEKILAKTEIDISDLEKIMQLHSSTAERYQLLPAFWTEILGHTSGAKKIVEYGCGLNGLSLLDYKLNLQPDLQYLGYDIDIAQTGFLNHLFQEFGVAAQFQSQVASIFNQNLKLDQQADLILLLKLLPTLEQQQKGIGLELLNKLTNKYLVVSFPVASLGRRTRNMTEFYTIWFEDLVSKLDFKYKITKIVFVTELVFVMRRL